MRFTCFELNKLINEESHLYLSETKNEFIALSYQNKYREITDSFDYQAIHLSEIFYKKFVKSNNLSFEITKTCYFVYNGFGETIIETQDISNLVLKDYKQIYICKQTHVCKQTEDYWQEDNTCLDEADEYLKLGFTCYHILYSCFLKTIYSVDSYSKLQAKIKEIIISNAMPSLLIHSCCGPCSSYILEFLKKYFKITILFYNPNIYPEEEYTKRFQTQQEIIDKMRCDDITILSLPYNHSDFLEVIDDFSDEVEGGRRCYRCYYRRLEQTAILAVSQFDYYTTTLSISPHKKSDWINEIGLELAQKYGVNFLYSNFKLDDGYKKSIEISKKYGLYRQDYCGCEFSIKRER